MEVLQLLKLKNKNNGSGLATKEKKIIFILKGTMR